jgi:predicted metal-dependent hydrolase
MSPCFDPLYLKGIEEFNRQEYFASHETWEALWRKESGPERGFYQGLIQAAVALHHLRRGNLRGAQTLLGRSRRNLDPYRPVHLGLDVAAFLADLSRCFSPCSPCLRGESLPCISLRVDSPG